jgi:hypothetical protein
MATKKKTPKVNVSQSLIKNVWEYLYAGGCGLAVKEIDILKKYETKQSDPMKLGQYFEYLCTGQTRRDGSIPEEPKTTKGMPTADGKRAKIQAENFNKMLQEKGIEVLETGVTMQHDDLKIVLDAVVKTPHYEKAILDIKYTGLLGDKWNDMGWTEGTYQYRHALKIQPIFYKYVWEKITGDRDVPFMYAIHSSKNEVDYDLWEVNFVDYGAIMEELEEEIRMVRGCIEHIDKLSPRPEMKRCAACPVFDDCMFKAVVPTTKNVNVFSVRSQVDT